MKIPKIARLECRTVEGEWVCAGISESLVPIQELAKEVRANGEFEGIPVDRGVVSATWMQSARGFVCEPNQAQLQAKGPKPRNAKG